MIEQVEITTEFIDFIQFEQEFIDYDYIYLLEVKEEDEINMDWAGKLSSIKNSMKTQDKNLRDFINKAMQKN